MTVGMPVKHLKDFLTVHQDRISQPSLREFLLYRVASIFLVDLMAIAATLCEGGGGAKMKLKSCFLYKSRLLIRRLGE